MWRMFFRRVELREVRTQKPRLPVFLAARGDLFLLHVILHDPDFRAIVVRGIANDHHLEDGILGRKIHFVMQLANQRTELLEESSADDFVLAILGPGRSYKSEKQ